MVNNCLYFLLLYFLLTLLLSDCQTPKEFSFTNRAPPAVALRNSDISCLCGPANSIEFYYINCSNV
ncbi:hypothetical protein CHUAL_010010 [Chamberlinius hualienensis]